MTVVSSILFIIIVLIKTERKNSTVAWLLGWLIVSPSLRVGRLTIDSTYLVVIVLAVYIAVKFKKVYLPPHETRSYLIMFASVNILYVLSWIIFSRVDSGTMLAGFFGGIKVCLLLVECWQLNRNVSGISYMREIVKLICMLVFINSLAVIYEMVDLNGSVEFLSSCLLSNSEINYLHEQTKWGRYQRYFGIFGYPMQLGIFAAYSLAIIVFLNVKMKKGLKAATIIGVVFIGLMSASKSFIFGAALVVLLYIVNIFMVRKQKRKLLQLV